MPDTFFGLDCYLFLPAAGNMYQGSVNFTYSAFRYNSVVAFSLTQVVRLAANAGSFTANDAANKEYGGAVRLASVVSEDLTHAGKCQKMLFVILSAAKNLCCSIVSSVVFSVPSCCGADSVWKSRVCW